MQPWVIMLLRFCKTSFGWQLAVPQLMWALRRSPGVGAHGVGRGAPGLGKDRGHVGLVFLEAVRVAAVAIGAAEVDGVLEMRIARVLVTVDATDALGGRLDRRLPEEVHPLKLGRH